MSTYEIASGKYPRYNPKINIPRNNKEHNIDINTKDQKISQ